MIELSTLTPDDWAIWRKLRLAALEEAPSAFGSRLADWQGDNDHEQRWRARLSMPGSHNVIALLDREPVGMASGVRTAESGVVELISMWVAPSVRGLGVGDELVREVERWARSIDANVLRLAVAPSNETAAALYQRNGFRYTGECGDVLPWDPAGRERIMAKTLADSTD